jgi:hypothetical protein
VSSPIADVLAALDRALQALGVRWYLFGAQAVLVYGGARLTADVDVTVEARDVPVAVLVAGLAREGFAARVEDVAGFVDRTRVVPMVHAASAVPVDVVLAGPGLEEAFLERARVRPVAGVAIPVAAAEDIIAMKLLAGRTKDLDDARVILAAHRVDAAIVRRTLRTLEDALDRSDLVGAFDALAAQGGGAQSRSGAPGGKRRR